jgi:aryl-alcohol dehydrogenase-like predicted oxidoreductase
MDRERVVVANKLWWEFWPREDAVAELHGSLERMRFDRLDLLYASTLPDDLPVAVAVEQIANVLATGLVGAWGIVNWSAAALAAAADEARRLGIPMPCAVQLPYSLAQTEWVEDPEMEAALATAGASLIPSATLAGGALSGKYSVGGSGRLGGETDRPSRQRAISIGARLVAEADRLNTTAASLAIAFTLLHPRTAATLVGATAPWQLDQAIEAVALSQRLSEDDRARLRSLGEAGG